MIYLKFLHLLKLDLDLLIRHVILENWGELIELDHEKRIKQVRYSTRLDYVPVFRKN